MHTAVGASRDDKGHSNRLGEERSEAQEVGDVDPIQEGLEGRQPRSDGHRSPIGQAGCDRDEERVEEREQHISTAGRTIRESSLHDAVSAIDE